MNVRALMVVVALGLLTLSSCETARRLRTTFREMQAVQAEVAKISPSEAIRIA
jgi:hypothetical protein